MMDEMQFAVDAACVTRMAIEVGALANEQRVSAVSDENPSLNQRPRQPA